MAAILTLPRHGASASFPWKSHTAQAGSPGPRQGGGARLPPGAALLAAAPPCTWSKQMGAGRVAVILCILSGAESHCCQGWSNKQMLLTAFCVLLPLPPTNGKPSQLPSPSVSDLIYPLILSAEDQMTGYPLGPECIWSTGIPLSRY